MREIVGETEQNFHQNPAPQGKRNAPARKEELSVKRDFGGGWKGGFDREKKAACWAIGIMGLGRRPHYGKILPAGTVPFVEEILLSSFTT